MFEIGIIEIILGVSIAGLFYHIFGTFLFQIKLTKRREGNYDGRLKYSGLLFSYIAFVFIMIYFRFISVTFCFLYSALFLALIVAGILLPEKSPKEHFIHNLAMVIKETKSSESFDVSDLLIPDLTFTAKTILRYGPKTAARLFFTLTIFLSVAYYLIYGVYSGVILKSFLITYIMVLAILGWIVYKKYVKRFGSALWKADKGSF